MKMENRQWIWESTLTPLKRGHGKTEKSSAAQSMGSILKNWTK